MNTEATEYRCHACGYHSTDAYTVEVINDLTGKCPQCDTPSRRTDFTDPRAGSLVPGGSPAEQAFDEAAAIQRRSDQGYALAYGAPPPVLAEPCSGCGWFRGHHMSCRVAGALTVLEEERS